MSYFLRKKAAYGEMGTCSFAKVPCKSRNLCDNFCIEMAATSWAVCCCALTQFSAPMLPNTRDRLAANQHRRTGRQGNRAVSDPLHSPWRSLCQGICKSGFFRISAPLAIPPGGRQREEIKQEQVHLSGVRTKRLGEAESPLDLRAVLQQPRRRYSTYDLWANCRKTLKRYEIIAQRKEVVKYMNSRIPTKEEKIELVEYLLKYNYKNDISKFLFL